MQSDFIQGRSIIENFATAAEMVQCAHKLKKPIIVLKLDFQKAFETIHWEAVVHSWHAWFPGKWIWWIHHLLASSQARIQINGHTGEKFCIRQGVGQGNQLSPYIFNLATDVLQQMIRKAYGCGFLIHRL